ncbi:MAG: hypothetical protein NTV68_02165 [Methanomicrobiales archaeon]|nr:hypothetical protein [Methanomicrobiales archaeon]
MEIRRANSTDAEVNQLLPVRIAPPKGWGAVVTCTFLYKAITRTSLTMFLRPAMLFIVAASLMLLLVSPVGAVSIRHIDATVAVNGDTLIVADYTLDWVEQAIVYPAALSILSGATKEKNPGTFNFSRRGPADGPASPERAPDSKHDNLQNTFRFAGRCKART